MKKGSSVEGSHLAVVIMLPCRTKWTVKDNEEGKRIITYVELARRRRCKRQKQVQHEAKMNLE